MKTLKMNSILRLLIKSTKINLLLFSSLLIFNISYGQTAFSVSWPFTNTLNATTTGNVTANAASMLTPTGASSSTPKTFYSQTNAAGFLTSIGEGGISSSSSNSTYDAVGSSTSLGIQNIVPLEYSFSPNPGNDLSLSSFTFSVEAVTFVSGTSISAGYSTDNGVTFTGLATPTVTGGGTANASPTGSIVLAIGNKFTFTVPTCTVYDGNAFKLRIMVWRNNGSGSSSSSLKFSGPSITGTTTPYTGPTINTTSTALTNFTTTTAANSTSQFITISAVRLDNYIIIGGSATSEATGSSVSNSSKYEMSTDNVNWQKTKITLSKSGTSIADTKIYFRLAAGNTQSSFSSSQNEDIIISTYRIGGSIIKKTISFSGIVTGVYNYTDLNNDITALSSWKNAANASPTSFTGSYQIFNLLANKELNAPFTISGSGSKLVIGNNTTNGVTLTIPTTNTYTGIIDIAAALSGSNRVNFNNATLPTLGTIDATSTIDINADFSAITTGLTSVGNLNINNGGKLKLETVIVNGNLNISGNGRLLLNNASSGRSLTLFGNLSIDGSNNGTGGMVTTSIASAASSYSFNFSGVNKTILSTVSIGTQATTYADNGNDFSKMNITFVSGSKYKLLSNFNYDFAGALRKITINSTDAIVPNGFNLNQGSAVVIYSAGGNTNIAPMSYTDLQITDGTTATNGVLTGNTKVYGSLLLSGTSYITTNDYLVFGSTSTNTGVLSNTSTASPIITGKVTLEKYIGNQRGWYIFQNPFSTAISTNEIGNISKTPFKITYSNNTDALKSSVKIYNNSADTWKEVTDSTYGVKAQEGFAIFNRGIGEEGLYGKYPDLPSNVTIGFKGSLTSTQTISTVANKYYVISNPFPIPISIASILSSNTNLSKKIAIYDPSSNSNLNPKIKAGNYITYDLTGINKGDSTDIVLPNLGSFIVKATTDGTVTINSNAIVLRAYTPTLNLYTSNTTGKIDTFLVNPGFDPDTCYLSSGLIPNVDDINVPGSINALENKLILTNSTPNGIWISKDSTIATINSKTGEMAGLIPGNTTINYVVNPTNGCNNFTSTKIEVGAKGTPLIKTTGFSSFCVGGKTTLESTATSNIQWYKNDSLLVGKTTNQIEITDQGNYKVTSKDANNLVLKSAAIAIIVYQIPPPPSLVNLNYCNFDISSKLFGTPLKISNTIKWYNDSTTTIALKDAPTPNTDSVGTYKYYATQVLPVGCESIKKAIYVIVKELPKSPIVADINYCNNFPTVALTAQKTSNEFTIKWYNKDKGGTAITTPTPVSTAVGAVKYYVSQTSPLTGCESLRSTLNVNTFEIPSPALISKDRAKNILTATSGTTFQWYKENTIIAGATTANYTPKEDGNYSTIISINGCFSSMSEPFEFINTSAKQDAYTINVGPNPFTNYIQLNYNVPSVRTVTISLFSMVSSKKVYEAREVLPNAQVPISNLAPGIYMVQIVSDDNRIVEKYKMIKL